jgi:hypothetical protein
MYEEEEEEEYTTLGLMCLALVGRVGPRLMSVPCTPPWETNTP